MDTQSRQVLSPPATPSTDCACSASGANVITTASGYDMVPAANAGAHSTEPDHAGSFEGLLMALNPYMDDMLCQPTFHLFMELPIELRCLVYDQYFLEEKSSIACRNWPHLQFSQEYERSIRLKRRTAPFLPSLCLVNKKLQCELLHCLLEAAHFEFDDGVVLGRILVLLADCSLRLHLTVRKATIGNVNGQRKRLLFGSENRESQTDARKLAQECNNLLCSTMPYLPELRELNLKLYAPLLFGDTLWNGFQITPIYSLAVDNYLCGFELDAILGLGRLEKLSITGISGDCNKTDQINRTGNMIIDDGKSRNLTAILDLCQQIKHGFIIQKRSVVIRAHLRYAVNKGTEETLW